MPSSLVELNALLDNFIPLTKKVNDAKIAAMQKESEALEQILLRVYLVLPCLHENGEVGQCPLINRGDEIPIGKDAGYRISNTLTLMEDGPRLEVWHTFNGLLQGIQQGEDSHVLVNLSGRIIELPVEQEGKLRPLMGLPARVARLDDGYIVGPWTRRARTCMA